MSQVNYNEIKQYVCDLLTVMGIEKDGEEQPIWLFLHHACCATAIYEVLDESCKPRYRELLKATNYFFSAKFNLKDRKGRKEKENFPPNPLLKEKAKKAKEEKNSHTVERGTSCRNRRLWEELETRREVFHQECLKYVGKYDVERLGDFYNHWSEENNRTGRMRFEEERYWNIGRRLKLWMNRSYAAADTAAAIRLRKAKKQEQQEQAAASQQQAAAAEREQEDAEREARAEKSRQEQMLAEEYIRQHPDSLMAKIYRQKKAKT